MWEMLLAYHFSNIFHMGYRGDMKVLRSQQADLVSSHPESRWEENKHGWTRRGDGSRAFTSLGACDTHTVRRRWRVRTTWTGETGGIPRRRHLTDDGGTSPVLPWLRIHLAMQDVGSTPGPGTKTLHAEEALSLHPHS